MDHPVALVVVVFLNRYDCGWNKLLFVRMGEPTPRDGLSGSVSLWFPGFIHPSKEKEDRTITDCVVVVPMVVLPDIDRCRADQDERILLLGRQDVSVVSL